MSIGSLFEDARRCLHMSFEAIKHHCLNTYQSGLIWIPKRSLIRNKYCGLLSSIPKVVTGLAESWGAIEHVMHHPMSVLSVSFSLDGTRMVSGSADNSVRISNAVTGEIQRVLEGHSRSVTSVSFAPDGTHVVSGSWDNSV